MRVDDCIKNVSKGLDLSWIIQFIFHSKYFADSDWLQSPNCRLPYYEQHTIDSMVYLPENVAVWEMVDQTK